MGVISESDVSDVNERIANAETAFQAFSIIDGLTRTMAEKVLDLNQVGADELYGVGMYQRRVMIGEAHGWNISERDDDVPADGRGPCADGFDSHSRRPWQCRHCRRRRIDHRPIGN